MEKLLRDMLNRTSTLTLVLALHSYKGKCLKEGLVFNIDSVHYITMQATEGQQDQPKTDTLFQTVKAGCCLLLLIRYR